MGFNDYWGIGSGYLSCGFSIQSVRRFWKSYLKFQFDIQYLVGEDKILEEIGFGNNFCGMG